MNYKDLLDIYIAVLIGCLTALTIVISILKDEFLGKSFREVIRLLSKGNFKKRFQFYLFGLPQILWNVIMYFIVVIYVSFLSELLTTKISFLYSDVSVFIGRVLIFSLIIHLVWQIYVIVKHFVFIYDKMIQLNAGNRVEGLDSEWQGVLAQVIIDSRTSEHYDILAKNVKSGNLSATTLGRLLGPETRVDDKTPIESYYSMKRYLLVRKYLKSSVEIEGVDVRLTLRDYELIGYFDDVQNIEELQFGELTDGEMTALVNGYIYKIRVDLQRGISIYEIKERISNIVSYLDGFGARKGAGIVSVLKNTLPYPEFTREESIVECLFSLLLKSYESRLFFEGYLRAVKSGKIVERFYQTIENKLSKNSNYHENFNAHIRGQGSSIETFDPWYTYYNSGFVSGYAYLSYHNVVSSGCEKAKETGLYENIYNTHLSLLCNYLKNQNNAITETIVKIIYKRAKRLHKREEIDQLMPLIKLRFSEIQMFSDMSEVSFLKSLRDKRK